MPACRAPIPFARTLPRARIPPRGRIEGVVLLALAAVHGWAIGGDAWVAGLGRAAAGPEGEAEFRAALTGVLRRYMAEGE